MAFRPPKLRDRAFLAWVTQHPRWLEGCLVCGRPAEVCHLEAKGMGGARGNDQRILPLCHHCHMESHSNPGWWCRWRVVVGEWFVVLGSELLPEWEELRRAA